MIFSKILKVFKKSEKYVRYDDDEDKKTYTYNQLKNLMECSHDLTDDNLQEFENLVSITSPEALNMSVKGWTLLHHSCLNGDSRFFEKLIARGANPFIKNNNKYLSDLNHRYWESIKHQHLIRLTINLGLIEPNLAKLYNMIISLIKSIEIQHDICFYKMKEVEKLDFEAAVFKILNRSVRENSIGNRTLSNEFVKRIITGQELITLDLIKIDYLQRRTENLRKKV